jgi:general secretion pathway protein D
MTAFFAALALLAMPAPPIQDRASPPAESQAPAQGRVPPIQDVGEYYIVNFDESTTGDEGLKLEAFVKICQDATGINFTYGKDAQQLLATTPLRMFGPKRIPKADFYNFFQIMMVINDFVCTKIGPDHLSVVVISSLGAGARGPQLRGEATYVQPDDLDRYSDQPAILITTVIDLPNTDVRTLSNSMRTMFQDANTQQIIPVGSSNSLIITGFGSNVSSIVKMLRFVDEAARATSAQTPEFEVLPLEYASADEIAETISELLEASRRAVQARGQQQAAQGVSGQIPAGQTEAKILVDPRTNSLLLMAMPEDMPRIKELAARLDVDVIERERNFHIYNLENVDSEELAETLDTFIRDAGRITPSGPGGSSRAQAQGQAAPATSSGRNDIVIVPDKTTNSLLIAASRSRYEEVLDLIRRLDRRQPQVLIETALIELSGSDVLDLGVELGGANLPGGFGVTAFGLSTFQDTNSDGIPDVRVPNGSTGTPPAGVTAGILDGDQFNMPILLQALQTRRDTNVLNVPSVLVNNNGSAKVISKDEQPTTQITATGGVGGQTQENFNQYVDAGITMQISPTISASRYLRLKISLEVSNFLGSVSGSIPPPKTTRTIDTTVNVPDGDTMVIGGIVTDNKGHTRASTPWLGDIPILGFLFRREGDSQNKTTLYFFVTPHIMQDRDFADLAEVSYRKKLEAADTIGADRIRVVDPTFQQSKRPVDMRGFEVPLYRSPIRGEVNETSVGLDQARVDSLLKEHTPPPQPVVPAGDPNAPSPVVPAGDPNAPPPVQGSEKP